MEVTKKLENRVFWFILILLLGLALYFIFGRVFVSPEEKALREIEELERAYREDTYGGATPEETLQLFIDALKAGDIDLASKYFIIDEQEKWRKNLKNIKEKGNLNAMVIDLDTASKGNDLSETSARFMVTNGNNEVITIIHISKGPNGIWKIIDL